MDPNFLIIGVQKGGTSSAVYHFNKHPNIYLSKEEIHFFDNENNFKKGLKWYRNFFKNINKKMIGEKTPSYVFFKKSIDRIHKLYPNMKLILFIREPISRAYSQYNMSQQVSRNDRCAISKNKSFLDVIKDNKKSKNLTTRTILQRGFYIDQINYILTKFKKEQLHIAIAEKILDNPLKEYNKIFKFLKVKPLKYLNFRENIHKRKYDSKITDKEFVYLYKIYRPYNKKLYNYLGYNIKEWDDIYNNVLINIKKKIKK